MINDAVSVIVGEFSLKNAKFYLAGSLAIVEPETDVVYLHDNILIIEEEWCPTARDSIGTSFPSSFVLWNTIYLTGTFVAIM